RPAGGARPAARLGDDRRARRDDGLERLLPDDAVLLLLRLRGPRAGAAARLPSAPVKVCVLTTSYPRWEGDAAGSFVGDAVEALRAEGVEVEVVSPARFRHFGIAYGHGVAGNLRAAPWKAALATGKPYVLQVWGTDVELARRAPALARPVVRRARMVVAASTHLARAAE